jgi:hypothetical protein
MKLDKKQINWNLKQDKLILKTALLYVDQNEEIWMQLQDGYCEYCSIDVKIHFVILQKALDCWIMFKGVMISNDNV